MEKLMLFVGYTAASFFIVLAIMILFTDIFPIMNTVSGIKVKTIFGIVLFLYGIYRIVIITVKKRKSDEETE